MTTKTKVGFWFAAALARESATWFSFPKYATDLQPFIALQEVPAV